MMVLWKTILATTSAILRIFKPLLLTRRAPVKRRFPRSLLAACVARRYKLVYFLLQSSFYLPKPASLGAQ